MTIFCLFMLMFGTAAAIASNPQAKQASFSVSLEVSDSLGVSLDGETIGNPNIIRVGDPAAGMVTYVVLDG
jgi:hypothetical protein